MSKNNRKTHIRQYDEPQTDDGHTQDSRPDWSSECEVCGAKPVVPLTGMCGPCTFGEAETSGGNW